MYTLVCQPIRNIKIIYEDEKTNIKIEDYFFNNFPVPSNIEINDVTSSGFKVNWKIDNNYINDFENQIKFKIEIKKENDNSFNQVYEDNNTNYSVTGLSQNTKYELRICCTYKDFLGSWSQIQVIKTKIATLKKAHANLFG